MAATQKRSRVLVVNDDPRIRRLYRDALEEGGYRVLEAEGADAALEVLDTKGADLAILDIRMPDAQGLELVSRLRATHPRLPIILCSAVAPGDLVHEHTIWDARKQIVGLFQRPVDANALVRCLGRTLGAPSAPRPP